MKKFTKTKLLSLVGVISLLFTGVGSAVVYTDQSGDPLTKEQIKQLNTVKGATAKYHDVKKAEQDGYIPVGDPATGFCATHPVLGTMGIHYFNPGLIDNPELTGDKLLIPERPELLLYTRDKNGNLKLVGVEYMVSEDEWKALYPDLTRQQMESKDTPKPEIFGFTFEGLMAPHGPGEPWHFDKHIWLFDDNPSGIDAQWNPSCTCNPDME